MSDIFIPFLPEWKDKMLDGIKTHTCRSKAYGKPGDRFEIFGATFELISIRQTTLADVALNYYQQEGCQTPLEFTEVWDKIHPRRKFNPDDVRWLHHFKKV